MFVRPTNISVRLLHVGRHAPKELIFLKFKPIILCKTDDKLKRVTCIASCLCRDTLATVDTTPSSHARLLSQAESLLCSQSHS
jgi:hypothetical protein